MEIKTTLSQNELSDEKQAVYWTGVDFAINNRQRACDMRQNFELHRYAFRWHGRTDIPVGQSKAIADEFVRGVHEALDHRD